MKDKNVPSFSEYLNEGKIQLWAKLWSEIEEDCGFLHTADWLSEDDFDTWDDLMQQAKKLKMLSPYIVVDYFVGGDSFNLAKRTLKKLKVKFMEGEIPMGHNNNWNYIVFNASKNDYKYTPDEDI